MRKATIHSQEKKANFLANPYKKKGGIGGKIQIVSNFHIRSIGLGSWKIRSFSKSCQQLKGFSLFSLRVDRIIHIEQLRKSYKGSQEEALKGVDLSIEKAGFFGLLGPNAAGKSTLISILCGILSPSAGSVELFGHSLNQDQRDLKHKIGLVPQEIALYPSLTVEENILYFGQLHGISGKVLKERTAGYIKQFNLGEHRSKPVSKCSGGIKRRVNLVAGVIHKPQLILLDEPTLGVDPQLRSMIFDFLTELNKAGATLIYTTHYMKEAEILCDRVGIIDHGVLLKKGSPEQLIASESGCTDLGQVFLKLTGRDLRD